MTAQPHLDPELQSKLLGMNKSLKKAVIGQDDALDEITEVLIQGELDLTSKKEPKGGFFFLGSTGIGKTQSAKAMAEYLFGESRFYQFDMSEFKHQDSIKNFIGDHTGNIGRLGRKLENAQDGGIILFDEIEKAHPDIRDLFLQIYDERRITVGEGKVIDLRNFYLIMTSNIGSEKIAHSHYVQFSRIRDYVIQQVEREFRPEFIRRFRNMIVFKKLTLEDQRIICTKETSDELERFRQEKGIELTVTDNTLNRLLDLGYDEVYGARNLRNVVQFQIRKIIGQAMLEGKKLVGTIDYKPAHQKFVIL